MAAEAAVSFAVQTLGNLLVEKVKFLQGVEEDVRWLKNELKRMQSFLKDASEKRVNDERVRNWISEIREVALDAQDAIELFILNVQNARRSRLSLPGKYVCFPSHLHNLNKIGKEIDSIRKRLQEIESSRLRYGIILQDPIGEGGADSSSRRKQENVDRRRRLAHWEDDKDVVGLEGDVNLLLQKAILHERDQGLAIATIVGMGGIGKSTLARKIYNNAAIAERFEHRAWVVVSSEFTPEETVKQIILQLRDISERASKNVKPPQPQKQKHNEYEDKVQKEIKELEECTKDKLFLLQKLQQMLCEQLEGKRYFIVLDDVWEHTQWETLKIAFPNQQDKASRLLVTSRNNVIVGNAQYVHEMKCLGPEESWELFLKKVFINNTNGKCQEGLEYIGRKILERCHGLPLAISVAGGLLVEQKESISGWEKVLKGIHSHLGRGQNSASAILELSYQNLDPQLKSCFLFLGLFKEDASIPAKKLIHVWVALDLVSEEDVGREETMEDVARAYLDELINRNMLQIEDTTKDGRVKTCRIHDLLRDLSIEKAKEEINFEILREEGSSNSSHHPRHRAMYCSEERFVESTNRNKHLHSLFVHSDRRVCAPRSSSYWKSHELLRILDNEFNTTQTWPDAIGALIGLRYLARDTGQESWRLPRSFSKLENLQVLDFPKCIVEVPNFLWRKESLRHLKFYWGELPNPHVKIHTLKNLQTLGYLQLKDPFIEQFTKMPGLCKLGLEIWKMSDVHRLFTTLGKLENLVRLHIRWCRSLNMDGLATLHRITQLKLRDWISRLPNNFPPNLSYLTLSMTELEEDPMPVLEKLPNLLHLKLNYDAYRGEEMEISHGGFPRLKKLSFSLLDYLSNIRVGEGAMPELQQWHIISCGWLKIDNLSLPEHLRSKIIRK